MRKIVLVYGIIAGVILGAMWIITAPLYKDGTINFDNGMLVGYTTMVVCLSMVFFGIKSYRDNHLKGKITFGQGFKVGILITLIASTLYVLGWEISYRTMNQDFVTKMWEHQESKLKEDGKSKAEIQIEYEKHLEFGKIYANPILRFLMTICIEILPVGLAITCLSAALLRRKELLPAETT